MTSEEKSYFPSDDEDDAPIVRRQVTDYEPEGMEEEDKHDDSKVNGVRDNSKAVDDLFGSDDDDDDNGKEETIEDSTTVQVGEREIYRTVRSLLVADSINWTVNSWASRVGEVLNVDFSERKDLKDILKSIVLEQAEAIRKAAEQSHELFGGSDDSEEDDGHDSNFDDDDTPMHRGRSLDFLHDEEPSSQLQEEDRDKPEVKHKTISHLLHPEVNRFPESAQLVYLKPPQQLKIQAKPFQPEFYSADKEYDHFLSQSEGSHEVTTKNRFFSENSIIRWYTKLGPDGNPVVGPDGKEVRISNAFFVKYKSGVQRLVIGKSEFDVQFHPISNRLTSTV